MKISEAFPSRFISAADLAKVKNDTPFVIRELKIEECRNPRTKQEEQKLIVYFRGVTKGHRLRKSEAQALIGKYGDDDARWVNQTVLLRVVDTKTGPGVRMVPQQGKGTAAPAAAPVAASTATREPGDETEGDLSFDGEIPETPGGASVTE